MITFWGVFLLESANKWPPGAPPGGGYPPYLLADSGKNDHFLGGFLPEFASKYPPGDPQKGGGTPPLKGGGTPPQGGGTPPLKGGVPPPGGVRTRFRLHTLVNRVGFARKIDFSRKIPGYPRENLNLSGNSQY